MAEVKTKPTKESAKKYITTLADEQQQKDCKILLDIMSNVTGEAPVMWGDAIVGFGKYHYKSTSGREGDWFITGFSPRKSNISLYLMGGFKNNEDLLSKLGKHKTGAGCLYVKKLADVDMKVLEKLIRKSAEDLKRANNVL